MTAPHRTDEELTIDGTEVELTHDVEYPAHSVSVADDAPDPLQAVLVSTGIDQQGTSVSVSLSLTPQVIVSLTAELHEVLRSQRLALGFDPDAAGGMITAASDTHDQDEDQAEDQSKEPDRERLLRRAGDPAGLRYLRAWAEQNPKVNRYIAAAVITLLLLALALKIFGH